jgi:hypothetical protein
VDRSGKNLALFFLENPDLRTQDIYFSLGDSCDVPALTVISFKGHNIIPLQEYNDT